MAEKIYPDWVQQHRSKGTTVKKVGNNYYLYKHSSKRVKGKKNPVPKDTYLGRITPEGVIRGNKKKITTDDTDIVVKEYGFSKTMQMLCTQGWKEPLGNEWRKVLYKIIISESPNSYIGDLEEAAEEIDPHIQFGAQKASFQRRMKKEYGVEIKDLKALMTIYLVSINGKEVLSRISDEQAALLESVGVKLEVC